MNPSVDIVILLALVLGLLGLTGYLLRTRHELRRTTLRLQTQVAERSRDEDVLRQSTARYDELVKRIPVGIYTMRIRADGTPSFEYGSDRFLHMLELNEHDLLLDAESVHGAIHAEDRPSLDESNRIAAQTFKPFRWEGRCRVYGETRWIRIESEPTLLANGDSLWNGVIFDITESKAAEAALRESEEKHRILFSDSPDALLIVVDGVFSDCNPTAEATLRGNRSMILGRSPSELSPEFQPDGRRSSESAADRIRDALSTGRGTFEWVHRRFDGTDVTVEVSISATTLAGKPALFTALRDISERKLAEKALHEIGERYHFITENVGEVVWTLDPQTLRFTDVSPSVEKLRGFTPQEVIAEPMDAALTQEGSRQVRALLAARIDRFKAGEPTPEHFEIQEMEQPCKDGSTVWTEVVTTIRVDPRTGQAEVLGLTRDITERKATEHALKELSNLDPLTGVLNYRAFYAAGSERIADLKGSHAALVFLDLDEFKQLNDELGHLVGDQALSMFATMLRKGFRDSDVIGRLGGDEFAVLAVSRTVVSDEQLLARFLAELGQANSAADSDSDLEASAGIAWWDPASGMKDLEDLIKVADRRMYRAKRTKKESAAE